MNACSYQSRKESIKKVSPFHCEHRPLNTKNATQKLQTQQSLATIPACSLSVCHLQRFLNKHKASTFCCFDRSWIFMTQQNKSNYAPSIFSVSGKQLLVVRKTKLFSFVILCCWHWAMKPKVTSSRDTLKKRSDCPCHAGCTLEKYKMHMPR